MDNPETHDDFFFIPAGQFEVMMDGRHFENTVAESVFTRHLKDDRERFHVEHKAEKGKGHHLVNDYCVYAKKSPEAKRPDIAHLKSCRFDIEISVCYKGADHRGVQYGHLRKFRYPA